MGLIISRRSETAITLDGRYLVKRYSLSLSGKSKCIECKLTIQPEEVLILSLRYWDECSYINGLKIEEDDGRSWGRHEGSSTLEGLSQGGSS